MFVFIHVCDYCVSLPCQDVLQRLHQSHLVLSSARGLEHDLWTSQTLSPHKQLVVLCHVEHGLGIKVTFHSLECV